MKNQASIQLLKVGTPINPNADTGHIMLCADADGNLRIFGENGVELPIGSAVDESRLVPTGGQGGNLLEYQEGVDRGNNVNTKLLLQPATSDGQIVDQAAGNAAPVGITNSGNVTIAANALVFSGENALIIEPNTLGMTLGGDNEYSIEVDFQLDQVKSDWATLFGGDGNMTRSAFYINSSGATAVQGGIAPDTTGWTTGTRHRLTIERFQDGDSWKTVIYRNGAVLATSVTTPNTLSGDRFPIGSNLEGTGRNFVGKIWAFRISNKAEHRGVSFTPLELPFLPPAGQPVWAKGIDRSRLLPENPTNGDIACFDADVVVGSNDETVKFLLQPVTSNKELVDSAYGNPTKVVINNHGLTVDSNCAVVFTTSTYGTIAADTLPADVLVHDKPWVIDLLMKLDEGQWSGTELVYFGSEGSGTNFWFQWTDNYKFECNYDGKWTGTELGNLGEEHLVTLEYYQDTDSNWYTALYLDGTFRGKKQVSSSTDMRNYDLCIGRRSSGKSPCSGQFKAIRIRAGAPYKGQTFTPDEFPYQEPQTVGEWGKFNISSLVKSVNGQTPDENGNVTVETGSTVDESRLLPDSGPDDSWMHHSESMDLVTPVDMTSMQSADWTLTAENVQNNFSCKPWGLFDSFANSGYLFSTTTGPSNCTWTRRDGTPALIDRLELYAGSASQRNGDSYEFYGSHNGSDWILLGSWKNTNWSADSVGYDNGDYYVLTLEVNNDTKYLHYKFVSPSTSLNGLKGYGVTTKNEWKKFPVATDSAAGLMSAADKAKLDGISTSEAWYTVADAAAITLDRANGELQKVTLTQNCVLTAPVLDADHSTLLLQVTSSSAVTVTVGETNIVTDHTGTFQVGWYWDGEATRRYPAVEIS